MGVYVKIKNGDMDKAEYLLKAQKERDWLPGKEALTFALTQAYGDDYEFIARQAIENTTSSLNGFYVFPRGELCEIVTCGLSCLAPHGDAYHAAISGWGVELTMLHPRKDEGALTLAFRLMDRLAQGIDVRKRCYPKSRCIPVSFETNDREALSLYARNVLLTGNTELPSINTIHGKVEFRQIINVSDNDVSKLKQIPSRVQQLLFGIRQQNERLVFQPGVRHDYFLL